MTDFVKTQPGILEGTMQSLLEARRMARSIEAVTESVAPLAASDHAKELLETSRLAAAKISHAMKTLYERNAKEAFGANGP